MAKPSYPFPPKKGGAAAPANALKAHMKKGPATAHPDAAAKKFACGGGVSNKQLGSMGRNLAKTAASRGR